MSEDAPKKKFVIKKPAGGTPKRIIKKPSVTLKKPKPSPADETKAAETAEPRDSEAAKPATAKVAKSIRPEEMAKAKKPLAEDTVSAKLKGNSTSYTFYCVYCGEKLTAGSNQVGDTIPCKGCRQPVIAPPPASDDPSDTVIVKFFCTECGQKLSAPATAAGTDAKCPACKTSIEIPSESEKPKG